MFQRKSVRSFIAGVVVLNILAWLSWYVYDVTGTCFISVGKDCEQASWGFAFLLGIQTPLLLLTGVLFGKSFEEFIKENFPDF